MLTADQHQLSVRDGRANWEGRAGLTQIFTAQCSCGWEGDPRPRRWVAEEDADWHADEMGAPAPDWG